jgi:hypothetical protein
MGAKKNLAMPMHMRSCHKGMNNMSTARQGTYEYNIEVHPCNHICHGKAIYILCILNVSVALVMQHAMHMCHIVIYSLSGSTIFFHVIS